MRQQRDTKNFVISILKICNLDVENVEKLATSPGSPKRSLSDFNKAPGVKYTVDDRDDQFSDEFDIFHFKMREARGDESLAKFIKRNIDLATIRTRSLDEMREEVQKLKVELQSKLMLVDIVYKCGWNFEHFRGCLKSLEKLHSLYGDDMGNLRNKTIIFSQFTGVSLDGDIHLFTGDVLNNWLDVSEYFQSFNSADLTHESFLVDQAHPATGSLPVGHPDVREHFVASPARHQDRAQEVHAEDLS